MEGAQVEVGVDAQLVAESGPQRAVGGESLGLPAQPVEGQHLQATSVFAERVGGQVRVEQRQRGGEVVGGQVRRDEVLHEVVASRGEPLDRRRSGPRPRRRRAPVRATAPPPA